MTSTKKRKAELELFISENEPRFLKMDKFMNDNVAGTKENPVYGFQVVSEEEQKVYDDLQEKMLEAHHELYQLSNVVIYDEDEEDNYEKIINYIKKQSALFCNPVYIANCGPRFKIIDSPEELMDRAKMVIYNTVSREMMFKVDDEEDYYFFAPVEKKKLDDKNFITEKSYDYILNLSRMNDEFPLD